MTATRLRAPSKVDLRRGAELAACALSGTTLLLLPKCPLCLAGLVALTTGIGLSAAAAGWLRAGLLGFCGGLLLILVGRALSGLVCRCRRTGVDFRRSATPPRSRTPPRSPDRNEKGR